MMAWKTILAEPLLIKSLKDNQIRDSVVELKQQHTLATQNTKMVVKLMFEDSVSIYGQDARYGFFRLRLNLWNLIKSNFFRRGLSYPFYQLKKKKNFYIKEACLRCKKYFRELIAGNGIT